MSWGNTTTRQMIGERGVTMGDLHDEYIAGATFTALGRRYGVSASALCKLMARYGEEGWARKSRQAREELVQDKIARIAGIAARTFFLKPGEIWRTDRRRYLTNARFAAFLVAIEAGASLAAISRAFECDHTTVMHGRDRARAIEERDELYRARLNAIRRAVT